MIVKGFTLDEYLYYARNSNRVQFYKEYDWVVQDPFQVYRRIESRAENAHYLEMGDNQVKISRYSYICFRPQVTFSSFGKQTIVSINDNIHSLPGDPYENLKKISDEWKCSNCANFPPLIGGCLGLISYNAVSLFENIPDRHANQNQDPELFIQFHERMILFDNAEKKIIIGIAVIPTQNLQSDYNIALEKIKEMLEYLLPVDEIKSIVKPVLTKFEPDVSDEKFCEKIEKAKEYIRAGDAFQIVLSRTFRGKYNLHNNDLFESLREINPSPCMFLFKTFEFTMVGSSPERLLSVFNRDLETWPIAGTRPRKPDVDDNALSEELLSDEKEMAEHMMLVDLSRNDIGSVSKIGSVSVPELKVIHRYSHIMHIVSKVAGVLKDDLHPLDALKAAFPAGTLSGAPKIRAMEIIDELEESRRGYYGGVLLIMSGNGDLDSFINIRSMFLKDGVAEVRAGAGVVFDSDPMSEANETRHKAHAQMKAFLRS